MTDHVREQYDVEAARRRLARDVDRGGVRSWRPTLRYARIVEGRLAAEIARDVESVRVHSAELPCFLRGRR